MSKHYQSRNTSQPLRFSKSLSILTLSMVIIVLMLVFVSAASSAVTQKPTNTEVFSGRDFQDLYVPEEKVEVGYFVRHEINNIVSDDDVAFYTKFTKNIEVSKAIINAAKINNVPINLAFALAFHESGFDYMNYNANSNGTADRGLFQLNDSYRQDWTKEQFYDVHINAHEGTRYISEMIELNDGDYIYALYCYNAGPHRVRVQGIIPDRTKRYVNDILEYEDMLNQEFNKWIATRA